MHILLFLLVQVTGDYLIADTWNHRVQRCPSDTPGEACTTVAGTGVQGNSATQLSAPTGVFLHGNDDLVIADRYNARVQVCSLASPGTSCTTVASAGPPYRAIVDGDGNFLILYVNDHRLQLCSSSNIGTCTTVAGTGVSGSSLHELSYPRGFDVDARGDYVIADSGNNRVVKCPVSSPGANCTVMQSDTSCTTIRVLPSGDYLITSNAIIRCGSLSGSSCVTVVGGAQLLFPEAAVIDGNGDYLVADRYNYRIALCSARSPETSCTTVAGTGTAGSGDVQLQDPHDVAFIGNGTTPTSTSTSSASTSTTKPTSTSTSTTNMNPGSSSTTTMNTINSDTSPNGTNDTSSSSMGLTTLMTGATTTSMSLARTSTWNDTSRRGVNTTNVTFISTVTTAMSTSTSSTSTTTTKPTTTSTSMTNMNPGSWSTTTMSTTNSDTSPNGTNDTSSSSMGLTTLMTGATTTSMSLARTSTWNDTSRRGVNTTNVTFISMVTTAMSTSTSSTSTTTTKPTSTSPSTTNMNPGSSSTTTMSTTNSDTSPNGTNDTSSSSMGLTTLMTGATTTSMSLARTSTWNDTSRRGVNTTKFERAESSTSNRNISTTEAVSVSTIASNSTKTGTTVEHTTYFSGGTNGTATGNPSDLAADAISVLLSDGADAFLQQLADVTVSDGNMIQELLNAAEALIWSGTSQVAAETAVNVVTVLADIASAGQPEDEVRSFTTPGGTVLRVMPPSSESLSHGFGLGPFVIPPLDVVQYENASVQVISWTENFFDQRDTSNEMITINFRKDKKNMALMDLDPPLHLTLGVGDRVTAHGADAFERSCVYWNTTAGNWSKKGLQVTRANLTQVGCESTHATTFAVQWTKTACPLCVPAPQNFFEFDTHVPASCWSFLALVLLSCLIFALLHREDRRDWIPVRDNLPAYFPPYRRRERSLSTLLWQRTSRFLAKQKWRARREPRTVRTDALGQEPEVSDSLREESRVESFQDFFMHEHVAEGHVSRQSGRACGAGVGCLVVNDDDTVPVV